MSPFAEDSPDRRILIPLDGSAVAEAIVPEVLRIARSASAELVLCRVVPTMTPLVVEGSRRVALDNIERAHQEAEQYLGEMAERLGAGCLRAVTMVRGNAATEIVEGARECGADLTAMTTHGRSGLSRLLFGSLAEAVLRHAPVPRVPRAHHGA